MLSLVFLSLLLTQGLAQGTWELHLLDEALYPAARCLDGSMGGFYVSPGDDQVIMHLQGGGWCTSIEDCIARGALQRSRRAHVGALARAAGQPPHLHSVPPHPLPPAATYPVYAGEPSIGSSTQWGPGPCTPASHNTTPPCASDGGSGGLLSSNPAVNPLFHAATKVWFGYCSGDSFSGDAAPFPVNATYTLHFAGKRILEATLATLRARHGLAGASAVVLSGCSAGGQAAFFQADHVRGLVRAMNPAARFVAAPGAGFFLDVAPFQGPNTADAMYKWVYDTMNISSTVSAACVAAVAPADPSLCFMAPHLLPFIETDLFVANSLADAAQQGFVMNLGCAPAAGTCSAAQLAYLDHFHDEMVGALAPVLNSSRHGAWLVSCSVHMVEDVDGAWASIEVGGVTQRDAFAAWYSGGAGPQRVVDVPWTQGSGQHGGNPLCGKYGPVPSPPRLL